MYRKITISLLTMLLSLSLSWTAHAGGWATVTLDDVPASPQAGESVTLSFTVLQHGITPLDLDDAPRLVLQNRAGDGEVSFEAQPTGEAGRYSAEITWPQAGEWTVQVDVYPFPSVELEPIVVEPMATANTTGIQAGLYAVLVILLGGGVFALWRGAATPTPHPEVVTE